MINFEEYTVTAQGSQPLAVYGKVADVVGLTIEATGPPMRIGDMCYLRSEETEGDPAPAEVVGFRGQRFLLMPLSDMRGIGVNSVLIPTYAPQSAGVGPGLLGRVLGSLGQPLDGGSPPDTTDSALLTAAAPRPFERERIVEPLASGVRSIDACMTCGKGQRVGIMSGSGVGKSRLLGMIARNTNADVNVIGLIGERGREVRDFVEGDLGPEGLRRSVVVAATSDEPALMRIKGAFMATAIAEWFREQGHDVLLMMDSLTRFAMAQREVGLAVGEPPTSKGYPPSVYGLLPQLLERAGTNGAGSITGMYTVLVEGDDFNDPIGDAVRSIVDGHIGLSRDLSSRGHFPAVDVLESTSRVMVEVASKEHQKLAARIRHLLAVYRDAEDLVNIGAYVEGSNPEIDKAIKTIPAIRQFLQQGLDEKSDFSKLVPAMKQILKG